MLAHTNWGLRNLGTTPLEGETHIISTFSCATSLAKIDEPLEGLERSSLGISPSANSGKESDVTLSH